MNDYLREISGQDFTAKDFRTWAGTALAAQALQEFQDFDSTAAAKRNITKAIERVAERLGNTQAICRKCYVHPAIIDAYMDRSLVKTLKRQTEKELRGTLHRLSAEEAAVLALLQQRMEQELTRGRTSPSEEKDQIEARQSASHQTPSHNEQAGVANLTRGATMNHAGRRDSDEHPAGAASGPTPVVALALASRHGSRHHVDPRRARSHRGRLTGADAAAGRHPWALGGRRRLGRIRLRGRRGARRVVLRPARRQARAQAAIPRDVMRSISSQRSSQPRPGISGRSRSVDF